MSEHVCDSGNFDRTLCPEPCGMMHSYCDTCGKRADPCAHEYVEDEVEREAADRYAEMAGMNLPLEERAARARRIARMINLSELTFRVAWSDEDDEWVGTCDEFPSLSWLASDRHEAFMGIRRLALDVERDIPEARGRVEPCCGDGRLPHRWPENVEGEVLAWTCAACGELVREYGPRNADECSVDWRNEP